jgi:hypothetical protein
MTQSKTITTIGWMLLGITLLSQLTAITLLIDSDIERMDEIRLVTDWLYFVSLLCTLGLSVLFGKLVKPKQS